MTIIVLFTDSQATVEQIAAHTTEEKAYTDITEIEGRNTIISCERFTG